jgi:hypothetical protein
MTGSNIPKAPKLRTFASDFAAAQIKQSTTPPSTDEKPTLKKVVPKASRDQKKPAKQVSPITPKTATPIPKPEVVSAQKPAPLPSYTAPKNQPQTHPTSNYREARKFSTSAIPMFSKEDIAEASNRIRLSGGDAPPATVIRDTKHKRFRFFPAVGNAISKWFGSKTKKRPPKPATYSVPATTRRKGVIEKATSRSGSLVTARDADLTSRIKARTTKVVTPPVQSPEPDEPEVFWSPQTEPGYSLLDAPDLDDENSELSEISNVTVTLKQSHVPDPEIEPSKLPIPEPELVDPKPLTAEQIAADEARWQAATIQTPTPPNVVPTPPRTPAVSFTQAQQPVISSAEQTSATETIETEERAPGAVTVPPPPVAPKPSEHIVSEIETGETEPAPADPVPVIELVSNTPSSVENELDPESTDSPAPDQPELELDTVSEVAPAMVAADEPQADTPPSTKEPDDAPILTTTDTEVEEELIEPSPFTTLYEIFVSYFERGLYLIEVRDTNALTVLTVGITGLIALFVYVFIIPLL